MKSILCDVILQALFMSNRQKIEEQTNLLNTEWSKLRVQSIPLSTSGGAQPSKKVGPNRRESLWLNS